MANSALLVGEEVFPVASPGFVETLAGTDAFDDPALLSGETLIHLDEPFLPSLTWSEWFAAMHAEYRDEGAGLRLNHYVLVLQAAMAGEGIAMGWAHLVDGLMEQGLLVRIGDRRWQTNRGFYLIWSNETPLSPQAEAVRGWIVEAASSLFPPQRADTAD